MNYIALGLIVYSLLMISVVIMYMNVGYLIAELRDAAGWGIDAVEAFEEEMEKGGTSMILAVSLGTYFIWLFAQNRMRIADVFARREKRMSPWIFFQVLAVVMSGQLLFGVVSDLMEYCLNIIGFTLEHSVESATAGSETISMFLYGCIWAPVAEELIYRGFVMRMCERYGRVFAIFMSALLFGIMHGNIPQAFFAFFVGLPFGFVAMEYSIWWAILLHFLNNCVFGDIYTWLTEGFSERVQDIIYYAVFGSLTVAGVLVLVFHFRQIRQYFRIYRARKKTTLYALTAALIIMFIVMHVGEGIMMIERL